VDAQLENHPVWSQILPLLATESIPAVAARFQLSPGVIAAAIRRSGMSRRPVVREDAAAVHTALEVDSAVPEAPAPAVPVDSAARKPSRIDAFRHLLGVETDGEVARKAGVGRKAVREYRARHGIPSIPRAAIPRDAPSTPLGGKRHHGLKSPLDAFLPLVGTLPDAELAARAGVSRGALYQYRTRRGIPAFVPAPVAVVAPAAPAPAPAPTPKVAAPLRRYGFTVTVRAGDVESSYVLVATDVADAAERAVRAVRDGEVCGVVRYLEAIG
jgi:hypothetical protein